MKIDEFEKLEQKINKQNFHESYKTLKWVMVALSYFGHVASIFLAFFMLSNILLGVMDNKPVVYVVAVIVLSAIELLKRDIFHKFSILYLKLRAFTKDVLPLFILSIAIIGISFYSSIKGASEYSSKGDKILEDYKIKNKKFEDSITKIYQVKIEKIEKSGGVKEIALNKLYGRQDELNNLALTGNLTPTQKKLLKLLPVQIKSLETENKPFIESKKSDIKSLEDERDDKIKKHSTDSQKESKKKKDDNSKNSVAFIIFSTLIEISILAGVYFKDYYDVRSHREKKNELEKDGNYQKWRVYKQILDIIYTEDTKVNQKLPSGKNIIDLCKTNDVIILNKDLTNFLKTMTSLGIIKVSGSTRYFSKARDLAFESLNKHFNIE
jgi:hypothetical protein